MRALLLLVIQVSVLADYELSIRLDSYRNPGHLRASGSCCDLIHVPWRGCINSCDNYFVLCLRSGPEDTRCSLGGRHTGEVGGDSLHFGDSVGDVDNPIVFPVSGRLPESVYLVVSVYDNDDYSRDEFIDAIIVWEDLEVVVSSFSDSMSYVGEYGRGTMMISFRVACTPGYYQQDCNTFCEPVPNHYNCSDAGEKECEENYYGPECSNFCEPVPGKYSCNADSGGRVCEDNYYTPDCEVFCEPIEGRSNCNGEGELECADGYYGSYCLTFCKSIVGRYDCGVDGEIVCKANYYGINCSVYCSPIEGIFSCDENGTKVCSDDYYGTDCAVFCVPRDDEFGHYKCEGSTGIRICLEGYREPATNCTVVGHLPIPPTSNGSTETSTPSINTERSGTVFPSRRERVSTGAIVGGVTGGILAVCILSIIIILCIYQHRRRSQNSQAAARPSISERLLAEESDRSNGIVGENPNYVPSAVGRHVGAVDMSGSLTLELTNPLYITGGRDPSYVSIDRGSRDGDGVYSTIDHREMRQPPYLPGSVSSSSGTYDYVRAEHMASVGKQSAVQNQSADGRRASPIVTDNSDTGNEFEALYSSMPDT